MSFSKILEYIIRAIEIDDLIINTLFLNYTINLILSFFHLALSLIESCQHDEYHL